MLYPKNQEKTLSKALFEKPTSEYRGTPFWAWNCELEEKELLWQLEVLKQMGLGGAHMHVRTGMATNYLSDEYMALIKACVEKCRKEEMLAWLYDEDRWPSGAAGGLVTKDMKYRARHLLFTTEPGEAPKDVERRLLACYDVQLDENGCIASAPRIDENAQAAGRKWYAFVQTEAPNPWYNNQTYANTLDKATIQRFIEVTYERYLETVGEDFGGVVPAIFTDEPQFARKQTLDFADETKPVRLPWSDDVPETFKAAYGEDILAHLPELLWELPDGQISLIRYHYHDHIAERFAQAFADQCGKWCGDHNLMLTGHMMEEPTLESQTAALGEAMRSYRGFQLPGIDMLCAHFEFTTAKQTQSAVHQFGRQGMLSELYGVTGWDYDFRGHKIQGDWQAALGVTVRVQHLSWVSMKGEAKRDYPASINYQSPWWKDYAYVEDHFARVNTAMTRGKPVVKVGVIHPVESYWLHWGPASQTHGVRSQMDANFQNVTQWLLTGSIDFDFISESLLPAQCETAGAPLQVGEMAYDAIVVPGCETLRSTTLERLEAFRAAGGRLIFLGDAPTLENAVPSARGKALFDQSMHSAFSRESVLDALKDVRLLDIRNNNGSRTENLVHQLREDDGGLWLFVAHGQEPYNKDIPRAQKVRIQLKGEYAVQVYDTLTGDVYTADAQAEGGKTTVYTTLYDCDSLLLRFVPGKAQRTMASNTDADAQGRFKYACALADGKACRSVKIDDLAAYRLDEPNVLLLDKAEVALDDGAYRAQEELLRADNALRSDLGWPMRENSVAQPWTVTEKKVEHTARLRFTVMSDVPVSGAKFALEDADKAKITVNGEAVCAPVDGWYVDKSIGTRAIPALKVGENSIEVELPFGRRTNIEWCYLLGDFGVQLTGERRTLIKRADKLGFDDVTRQGLAHYGGNIEYIVPFVSEGGEVRVQTPHYTGAGVRVAIDGKDVGYIVYPPYTLSVGKLEKGEHTLTFTVLGNRENAFGPLHKADAKELWIGPNAWRTQGEGWTESYRVKPLGLRTPPQIVEIKK